MSGTSFLRTSEGMRYVPRAAPHFVTRRRLLERLDTRTPLTLLRAPTGFGKTSLVAHWLRQQHRAEEIVAWMRVRPGAGDGASVWADVVDVLADAGLPLQRSAQHLPNQLAAQAERALAAADVPVVLVVDGFENLADGVDQSLLDLVRYAPPLQLIVCGRSHRQFPNHLYIDLETTTISARDLLFTAEETAQLMGTVSAQLSPSDIATIHDACGGWPEPTRASALALQGSQPTQAELLAVADTVAIDYLRRHVLPETTRPDRLNLALTTALPEEFTAALAVVLSGDPEAKARLEMLAADGILLAQVRDGEQTYRWPRAARTALLKELSLRDPARVSQLRSQLASWYLENAKPELALPHAVQAEDWPLAIRVIESSYRALVFANRHGQLYDALLAIPLDLLVTSPLALAVRDVRLRVPDEMLAAAAYLPDSPAELARIGSSDNVAHVLETGFAVLGALQHRGTLDHAQAYATGLLQITDAARSARPGDIRTVYPSVQLHAGITRMAGGDLPGALRCLWNAYFRASDNPRTYIECDAAGKTALVHAIAGDVPRAMLWLTRHDAAPLEETWVAPMIRASATAARLLIALDRLDLVTATDEAAREELSDSWDNSDMVWAYYLYAQAQVALHTGRAAGALDQLDRARVARGHWYGHGAIAGPLLAAAELDLLLALGRANQARAVLTSVHSRHPLLQVGRARLALISGDDAAALGLTVDSTWDRSALARHRLEMLLIRAVAAHRGGDESVAADALRRAVDAAAPSGSVRAFATVPRDELIELAARVPAATDLLNDSALRSAPDVFPRRLTLVRLTAREQLVLHKLSEGLTTRQIADTLVVSVNTIKTQLRSLYSKLGTASRHEALALGRQWGLLPDTVLRRRHSESSPTEFV